MNKAEEIEKLLQLPQTLKMKDLNEYIEQYLTRKQDRKLALQELDNRLALLSNFVLLLSMNLKQRYLLEIHQPKEPKPVASELLTRKEVARRFRVDEKTVANWIKVGLKATEIGGVNRISEEALQEFMQAHKTRKFSWPSVGNRKAA